MVKMREHVERQIIRRILLDAKEQKFTFAVNNGEDGVTPQTNNVKQTLDLLFATDEEYLIFYRDHNNQGWVYLVHGNGPDVVSDFSTNLETLLQPALNLADKYA